MSLKLIYGRAGSGKSEYCFNRIAEEINTNKIFIITPEQFSFTAEKKLMNAIKTNSVFNAEVITFNRMAYRIMQEIGFANKTNLTKCGKAMLIYDVLNKNKNRLKFLGKNNENIEIVGKSITEFKKHGITVQMLKDEIENQQDEYLKLKLKDMLLVYEEFQNSIIQKYIDENDTLTILSEYIDKVDLLKDSIIYIDEFVGFTTQEYNIIEKILKIAKCVNITICSDDIEVTSNPEKDVFYANKITAEKLINIAKKNDIKIAENICLNNIYRYHNEELKHLESNIFEIPYRKYDKNVENISIFLANNQYTEIEYIAKNILKLVRDNKYRYNNIAVITKNIDTYSSLIKAIFSKYNIPVFIDEKKDLSQNLIVKYLISILDIFSKNWSYESVFNYLKIGLNDIEQEEIYKLENYCTKWGITGNKWYKSDWNFGILDEANEAQVKRFNVLRRKIVDPLLNFKNKIIQNKTAKEITKLLYEFLIEMNIEEKIASKIEKLEILGLIELANEYKSSFKNIIDVFDEIVLIFQDERITFEKYTEILKIGLKNSGLGKIPATQDQVIIGDIDRSRSHKVKAIFLIGLNDGMFPSVNKNEGFFSDKDREKLKENNIELAKGTLEQIYDDNFNIYKAFTTAEEKIYLSYSSLDSEGKTLRPSIFISKIKKIFPHIKETSDDLEENDDILNQETTFDLLIQKINEFNEGKEIDERWIYIYKYYENNSIWKSKLQKSLKGLNYTNIPDNIEKVYTDKLYGDTLHTTISRLEQYRSCPFSFYLKYGLNLNEKETFTIRNIDTGTFMHDVIDELFDTIKNRNIDVKAVSDDYLDTLVKNIIEEKLNMDKNYVLNGTSKFKVLTERLIKVVSLSIKYIIEGLRNTDFKVIGNEVEFKTGKAYPPIKLELDNGKRVEITGKIDRIDLGKTLDGKYIRIIDYKSSVKNIDLNEVISGVQLQLLTYLDATCEKDDVLPAGVLYFNLIDPIIKANKPLTDEQIEQEIKKKFKMNGLILADINVVKMMDKKLENGASDTIPVYLDKEGNISNSKSSTVTKEQFNLLQKYVKKTIKEISKELYNGNIDLKPYFNLKSKKTPCDYCEYKAVCQFDTSLCGNKYNYIGNLDKNLILDMIKESK